MIIVKTKTLKKNVSMSQVMGGIDYIEIFEQIICVGQL